MLVCNTYIWAFFCAYICAFVRKWSCTWEYKPHKAGKYASIRGKKNARISCSRNDCKYTWEKTHVYRVTILKQVAVHTRRLLCTASGSRRCTRSSKSLLLCEYYIQCSLYMNNMLLRRLSKHTMRNK